MPVMEYAKVNSGTVRCHASCSVTGHKPSPVITKQARTVDLNGSFLFLTYSKKNSEDLVCNLFCNIAAKRVE